MEKRQNSGNIIPTLTKGILGAFALSLLISIYLLFTLPADLRFRGNLQNLELVSPILIKLYITLAITAIIAVLAVFTEIRRVKVAIVYKEKTTAQVENEKVQAESTNIAALDAKSIAKGNTTEILNNALNALAMRLEGAAGACYLCKEEGGTRFAELVTGFALPLSESDVVRFNYGDGIVGQAAKSGASIYIDDIPEGYFQVVSGLGQASPKFILILPLKKNNEVKGILEVATFKSVSNSERQMAEKFATEIGESLS